MKVELLPEPHLEFGDDFISDDPKMGITVGGFFSHSNSTHRSEIHFAIIGTNNNTADALTWVKNFHDYIEASDEEVIIKSTTEIKDGEVIDDEDVSLEDADDLGFLDLDSSDDENLEDSFLIKNKRLNPDFIGFNKESKFACEFVNDEANNIAIKETKIKEIIENKDIKAFDRAVRVGDLYIEAYKKLIETSISKPNICLIIVPSKIFKLFSSIPMGPGKFFNFRRYLKANLICLQGAIPVQIILEDTILGKKKSLQDLSLQGWNFCVANYYKNNCSPWTLSLKDRHTCFIGISFHKVLNGADHLMRSSIAQAFNYEGKGIIFVGKQFKWDKHVTNTPAPHLTYEYAKDLIKEIIREYKIYNDDIAPNRVVIHKTSDFWNSSIHQDYSEVEGLKDGIKDVLGENATIDLVTIKSAGIKLLRQAGDYPVIRGTLLHVDQATGVLYTTGYIPYYETFPSVHIPRPLEVSIYEGETTLKKVCEEILALTKLNFNNCNYYDSMPITVRFAQKVGEIIQYMDEKSTPPNKYFFYM
jgi:hypothetical protein